MYVNICVYMYICIYVCASHIPTDLIDNPLKLHLGKWMILLEVWKICQER